MQEINKCMIANATEKTLDITPSVVALCVALKISAPQFVKSWTDAKAQMLYMVEVQHELAKATIENATKEDKSN